MLDLQGTFDSTNALSGMFLWLIFGYLSAMINCDLQRYLLNHPIAIHLFAIIAFFFLFAVIDSNNKHSIGVIWIKTVIIYILFVLMTKSKWYFVIPVLVMLLVDQSLKRDLAFYKARLDEAKESEKEVKGKDYEEREVFQQKLSVILNIAILVTILIGTIHYMYLQWIEYGSEFSLYQFFFSLQKCKSAAPDYGVLAKRKN